MSMPTVALEELAQYVRDVVPMPKLIGHLHINDSAGVVAFHWQGHEFLVKPTLETLELRNGKVYLTGASTLMQLVFLKGKRNRKVMEGVLNSLDQAEEMLRNRLHLEKGFSMLRVVKNELEKLR